MTYLCNVLCTGHSKQLAGLRSRKSWIQPSASSFLPRGKKAKRELWWLTLSQGSATLNRACAIIWQEQDACTWPESNVNWADAAVRSRGGWHALLLACCFIGLILKIAPWSCLVLRTNEYLNCHSGDFVIDNLLALLRLFLRAL